jgi:hypothetical protein
MRYGIYYRDVYKHEGRIRNDIDFEQRRKTGKDKDSLLQLMPV